FGCRTRFQFSVFRFEISECRLQIADCRLQIVAVVQSEISNLKSAMVLGRHFVAHRWLAPLLVLLAIVVLTTTPHAQPPPANPGIAAKSGDLELVQKLLAARREYQKTLEQLYVHYHQVNDK